MLVNPGSRAPVDGTVLDGHSFVVHIEESPVEKTHG